MSWTKRQIITQAFSELGLAAYVYNLTADELQDAMRRLDTMMGLWAARNVIFNPVYPQPTTYGAGDLDDDTNAVDSAIEPMYLNLAIRLAPSYGKQPSPDTRAAAKAGYTTLLGEYVVGAQVSLKGTIKGAGAKEPLTPFIDT